MVKGDTLRLPVIVRHFRLACQMETLQGCMGKGDTLRLHGKGRHFKAAWERETL